MLTAVVTSTNVTQTVRVVLVTFNVITNPISYMTTQLESQVLAEIHAPSSATMTSTLISSSVLGDGQRSYLWEATVTWTV
jgi:hypothetical protein